MKKSLLCNLVTLPQVICCHLFGEEHPMKHRIVVGLIMCGCGLTLTYVSVGGFKIIGDAIGLSLHAIGFTPVIDKIKTPKQIKTIAQ